MATTSPSYKTFPFNTCIDCAYYDRQPDGPQGGVKGFCLLQDPVSKVERKITHTRSGYRKACTDFKEDCDPQTITIQKYKYLVANNLIHEERKPR